MSRPEVLLNETIKSAFKSVNQQNPDAMKQTQTRLPDEFPGELMESIVEGMKSRKRLFEPKLGE